MMKQRMRKFPGLFFISLGFILTNLNVYASLSFEVEKRMDKELIKHLETKNFQRKAIIIADENLTFKLEKDCLFSVKIDSDLKGYVFIDEAMGRYHAFTFMVFVSPQLEIKFVSVLQYDEEYGSEITNRKWLEQFKGLNPESEIKYKENIDAISGATISSRSITEGVKEVLQKLFELKEKGFL